MLTPELRREIDEAICRALLGIRDPAAMKQACERMDLVREEIRREHGVLDIGIAAIREARQ